MNLAALVVIHSNWLPERMDSFAHMAQNLGPLDRSALAFNVICERAPMYHWSEIAWAWAAQNAKGPGWCLFLQDDLELAPNYLEAVRAVLEAAPGPIVGLETVHPVARELARKGKRWCSTADGLIGRAYALELDVLRAFLEWRHRELVKGAVESIAEDVLIGLYAMSAGLRIYHPIPSLQRHRTELASAMGNDRDGHRIASVLWTDGDVGGWDEEDLTSPEFWAVAPPDAPGMRTIHLGRLWEQTPWIARRYVKKWSDRDQARALADVCPIELARRAPATFPRANP